MQPQNSAQSPPSGTQDAATAGRSVQARSLRTADRIVRAVIDCLDAVGYADTTVNLVQETAGISRGALTHHFPSKEAMIVEAVERLLDPVRDPSRAASTGDVADDLTRMWSRIVNTKEGRALFEILVAARTRPALREKISPGLTRYNSEVNRNALAVYSAPADAGDDDVALLWTICRTFMRGLHVQQRFAADETEIAQVISRFVQLIAPHLIRKQEL